MRPQIFINCGEHWFEFSRSRTGQLDFEGRVEPQDTSGYGELASSTYFSPAWYIFLSKGLNNSPRVFVAEDVDVSDKGTFSYLLHIGALLNAIEAGDSLLAGQLYLRRKFVFNQFAPLSQYILRDLSVEMLFSLCFGTLDDIKPESVPPIYEEAKSRLELDLSKETLEQALIRYFCQNQVSLSLPLVGTCFHDWNPVPDVLDKLTDNLFCHNLLERTEEIRRARQEFYESIRTVVQAEPYNRHDNNALLVCAEDLEAKLCGNPGLAKAGYIRATAAKVIRQAKPKKLGFKSRLLRISCDETVLQVEL